MQNFVKNLRKYTNQYEFYCIIPIGLKLVYCFDTANQPAYRISGEYLCYR